MIVCAGGNELIEGAIPIGIGLIDPAINLTRLILDEKPKSLIFVGTAGSYGDEDLLSIHESRVASQIELSFIMKKSYTPIDNVVSSTENVSRETIVNSSNYITTDRTLGAKMIELGIALENMEFFSVMRVAQKLSIPCGGIFCITNYCDEKAHDLFIANHARAKEAIETYIKQKGYK